MGGVLSSSPVDKTVVIVGGGYAGIALAKALDPTFHVQVIELKEVQDHCVAGLRAYVSHDYAKKVLVPYDSVLKRGKMIQAEVVGWDEAGKKVKLSTGEEIPYDYLVLALGMNPAALGRAQGRSAEQMLYSYHEACTTIEGAQKITVVGGGPIGIELVGEMHEAFPTKEITLIHNGPDLCSANTPPAPAKFKAALHDKLVSKGIKVIVNDSVDVQSSSPIIPGKTSLTTKAGKTIETDLILKAVGVTPPEPSPFLTSLASKCDDRRQIKVDEYLRVQGCQEVFALGDCAATGHAKTLIAAAYTHAPAVAQSIKALVRGKPPVKPSSPMNAMMVPIGATDGTGYLGGWTMPSGIVVSMKAKDLFLKQRWSEMGKAAPA